MVHTAFTVHVDDGSDLESKQEDVEPKIDIEQIEQVVTKVVAQFRRGHIFGIQQEQVGVD